MSSPETESSAAATRDRATLRSRLMWIGARLLPVVLFFAAGVGLILLMGVAQRLGWLSVEVTGSAESGIIYTCSMHPNIRQPVPGFCPICGMRLVPVVNGGDGLVDELAVHILPAHRRLANIQTAEVKSAPLMETLETVGSIAIDESRLATIAAWVDGRLERLFADYTGVQISKGDHLAIIYSPQLFAAQAEFLEARRALSARGGGVPAVRQAQESLAANARHRLSEFGMTDAQLLQLEQEGVARSRLTIYAPQGGTVVEKLAVEGKYVEAGDPIYRIADLSTVWLMLKLFPEDAARVRFGQRAEAVVASLPGQTFEGRVAFIDPVVNETSRTVDVRVELANEKGQLRPGDYASATIELPIGPQGGVYDANLAGKWISPMHPQIIRDEPGQCPICGMDLVPTSEYGYTGAPVPQPESMYVPRSAVLLAGGNSVVYVETEAGRFEIRPVTIGPVLGDRIVILEGLEVGEHVATAGNFLIDSQMQLEGKPSLIDPVRARARQESRPEGPLQFTDVTIQRIGGEPGTRIEQLYDAYFAVQTALAADEMPPETASESVGREALALSSDESIPEEARPLLQQISDGAEHLAHMELKEARVAFRPISHAIVELATQLRGEEARESFAHFHCPMVPGGGGDWLQEDAELRNPFFGSEMLRCGEKVGEYGPGEPAPADSADDGKAR